MVAATAVGAVLAGLLALRQAPSLSVGPLVVVGLLIAALICSQLRPTFIAWGAEGDDITLDEALLVVGFALLPTPGILLASLLATLISQGLQRRPLRKAIFNASAHGAGVAAGALLIHATVGSMAGPLTASRLLALAGAVTLFCVVQGILVWLVIACASGSRFREVLAEMGPPAALSCAITASWGLLMAIAVRHIGWTIVLGLAPFVLLRALHRADRDRGRLRGLLQTATATATATSQSREMVQASVEDAARSLLDTGRAEVRTAPPGSGELGAALPTQSGGGWLVVGDRNDANPFDAEDQELLDGIAAVASIALDNAEMLDHLGHAALHDPLTALPNRLLFTKRAAEAIERCQTEGTRFGVLSLDLDRFKRINDNLGHLAGDELLRQVAARLDLAVDHDDTVCRMGGDELAVIVSGSGSVDSLVLAAQRLLDSLAAPFDLSGSEVFATASVGIARFPVDGATPDLLLRAADRALYAAKAAGRNGFMVHEPDDAAAGDLALERDLHVALDAGQLWVAYQPVVSADGGARSVEALARWDHPDLGPVPPERFLRVAEEVGLIAAIDRWVLDQAVGQLARWRGAGLGHVRMAVNVSARTLSQTGFEDNVALTLARHGCAPHQLELEVTEQTAVQEPLSVIDRLRRLRASGITIAIDDFGTGYSSLSRLHAFPSDRVKVDRSFVATLTAGTLNPIVAATIAMAHHLGLEVIAEGVETDEQLAVLAELGCDASQGWLFAPALPAEDAGAELLRRLPPDLCELPSLTFSG